MSIRTRYAPSPTGQVHIGNIRVAIFNWLLARHHGGQFLLRVEDTDRERSTPEAVQKNFDAMEWLGLTYDEEPVYQSQRREAHLAAAEQLLAEGKAYKSDFGSPEKGEAVVFRMPGSDMSFTDEVKGTLTKKAEDMKDLVIVRGDGNPVFHLANVVDDIFMKVNLVVRGDDHVENTFRHLALYEALGAEAPRFAHLPMIVNAQGKPYSKRDGDAFVGDFRERGFLPDALFNYLSLLGWNPGDDQEVLDRDQLIALFDFGGVQSSPAQMDFKKLEWMNGQYFQGLRPGLRVELCEQELNKAGYTPELEQLGPIVDLLSERLRFASDIVTQGAFFFTDEYAIDEKQARKRLEKEGVPEILAGVHAALDTLDHFTPEALEKALHDFAEEQELGLGKINPAIRVKVTGLGGGPDLVDVLAILGKERVLERLSR